MTEILGVIFPPLTQFQKGIRMKEDHKTLPVFGVGPVYVVGCLLLTALGLGLKHYGVLQSGELPNLKTAMLVIGILLIAGGIALWGYAVIVQRISEKIKKGQLLTNGVYALVRNPIYSAFLFLFTGALVIANNLYLLLLPIVFWACLTILMKRTEEKWLREKFGQEYIQYCKRVNRVIPWFRKL